MTQRYWLVLFFFLMGSVSLSAEALSEAVATNNVVGDMKKEKPSSTLFLLDHFEDGDYLKNPTWWTFGSINLSVGYNTSSGDTDFVQKRSLIFQGLGARYIGGAGMYYPKDLSNFEGVRLVLWGNGPESGHLQIQLFDDDNGNFVVETFPDMKNTPSKDDIFLHTQRIDWQGWREVLIPFSEFHDANPGIGDDGWNPKQTSGSGGFLQVQLIAMSAKPDTPVFFKLDSIGFVRGYAFPKDSLPAGDILEEPSFQENIDRVTTPKSFNTF